jgi:hypothetical protein
MEKVNNILDFVDDKDDEEEEEHNDENDVRNIVLGSRFSVNIYIYIDIRCRMEDFM